MMGIYFLVLCALGVLRPVRNALALDGLGGDNFYRVYVVSAVVIFVAPLLDALARRFAWRRLIPATALAFVISLLAFRVVYVEGSAALGYAFYGFYDVCSAALVTLFFIAAQLSFDAREARTAYPMIIAAGSLGATVGGAVTGFFTDNLGAGNLLFVSAALIAIVALGVPIALPATAASSEPTGLRKAEEPHRSGPAELLRDRHVRLIGLGVLLMVLVKQLVDYQFNALTQQSFQTLEAITAFQGKFNAATQWLPFMVLLALRPGMKRWGVTLALFLLPVGMLAANVALAVWWTLWTAVGAQATEMTLRNSAERSAREVLYVPLADDVKPTAKAYIDATLADGIGKVASVVLIGVLLAFLDLRQIAFVTPVICLLWLVVTVAQRREYVDALARSIRGRYASFRGVFAGLADAGTIPVVEGALASGDALQASFALDLVSQGSADEIKRFAPQLHGLAAHESPGIRERSLKVLERSPRSVDTKRIEAGLTDPESTVREAAVRVLCAADVQGPAAAVRDLLASTDPQIRIATLACLARGEVVGADAVDPAYIEAQWARARDGAPAARLEMALATGALRDDPQADRYLSTLLDDPDEEVRSAAIHSAGLLNRHKFYPRMIAALGVTGTRRAAMEALRSQGDHVVPLLSYHLLDTGGDVQVRLAIPNILAGMPDQATVDALLESFLAPETGQFLDFRTLKALNRIRAADPDLEFDSKQVSDAAERELEAVVTYDRALGALADLDQNLPSVRFLMRALRDAWFERREAVFRCLALEFGPEGIFSCFRALSSRAAQGRANALEWLEQIVGHARFAALAPALVDGPGQYDHPPLSQEDAFFALWQDNDTSLTYVALRLAADLEPPWLADRVGDLRDTDPWNRFLALAQTPLSEYALSLIPDHDGSEPISRPGEGNVMDPLEKIFLLQNVDVLRDAQSAHFSLLATIAEEVEAEPGTVLLTRGDPPDALYVVVDGRVDLESGDGQVLGAEAGRPFGTWALIDQAPSLVTARVSEDTRLVRVTRADFHDLLADYPELATELLQGLARKVRALVQ